MAYAQDLREWGEANGIDTLSDEEKYNIKKGVYLVLHYDDSLMLQGTHQDTILRDWYDSVTVANIGQFASIGDTIDVNNEFGYETNLHITPENHMEENEQAVNSIYFATWGAGITEFDDTQFDDLTAIAYEDPVTGGTGVYMARTLLGLDLPDSAELGHRHILPFIFANQQSSYLPPTLIYPNPTKDYAIFENWQEDKEYGNLEVFDVLGNKINEYNLLSSHNIVKIEHLSSGVYFLKEKLKNKINRTFKLTVIN